MVLLKNLRDLEECWEAVKLGALVEDSLASENHRDYQDGMKIDSHLTISHISFYSFYIWEENTIKIKKNETYHKIPRDFFFLS